jgi:nucleoside-diphosphate-sugar epimerase
MIICKEVNVRVLVFGADGFIGRNVCVELEHYHSVFKAINGGIENKQTVIVDLTKPIDVFNAISKVKPQAIVNCAGIVSAGMDVGLNQVFSKNIIEQAALVGGVERIIVSGSAGEYGFVGADDNPVNEELALRADSGYGLSKLLEEKTALEAAKKNKINVIILRIFNPIGLNMANRFLLTNLMGQIEEIKSGQRNQIELSRLDSKRDYIAVTDIASAFGAILNNKLSYNIYNVGSGVSTTNGELLNMVIESSGLDPKSIIIKETSTSPEPLVANMADTTRISTDTGWAPKVKVADLVREIYSK